MKNKDVYSLIWCCIQKEKYVLIQNVFGIVHPIMAHLMVRYPCQCVCVKTARLVTQSCLTLCDTMGCSLPGSSVNGISQARILEWASVPSSRGSSRPRDGICISCIGRWILHHWATWEVLNLTLKGVFKYPLLPVCHLSFPPCPSLFWNASLFLPLSFLFLSSSSFGFCLQKNN